MIFLHFEFIELLISSIQEFKVIINFAQNLFIDDEPRCLFFKCYTNSFEFVHLLDLCTIYFKSYIWYLDLLFKQLSLDYHPIESEVAFFDYFCLFIEFLSSCFKESLHHNLSYQDFSSEANFPQILLNHATA